MTETEWNSCREPDAMLEYLRTCAKLSNRKLRLFAAACCRRAWHLFPDPDALRAIEAVELRVDGDIDDEAYHQATRLSQRHPCVSTLLIDEPYFSQEVWFDTATLGMDASGGGDVAWAAELEVHCGLVREVFGNPFQPTYVHSARLKANKGRARQLAREVYDHRAFDHMGELARALEAARCFDAPLLKHLRSPGPHVRGCWALDVVLGKA